MKMRRDRFVEIKYIIADYVDLVSRPALADYADRVSPERFRWDLFWCGCRARPGGLSFDLYADGINDTHIDTVLRNIMTELDLPVGKVV